MRAFHLAKQQRAGGGDHEIAEDRADQAVSVVSVVDELGEGRDEGAEDDGQRQDREQAIEVGDAEDVEDLGTAVEQQRIAAAPPGGRCARRTGRRQISA